jgi:hypothetical protein
MFNTILSSSREQFSGVVSGLASVIRPPLNLLISTVCICLAIIYLLSLINVNQCFGRTHTGEGACEGAVNTPPSNVLDFIPDQILEGDNPVATIFSH